MTERQKEKGTEALIAGGASKKPLRWNDDPPRRFFEKWPVIVSVAVIVGLIMAAHFLSGCRLLASNMKYGHFAEASK